MKPTIRTVIALFPDNNEAKAALLDLKSSGFTEEQLSLVAYDGSGEPPSGDGNEFGENAAKGAAAGGLAGLLLGLAALAIPGIGPIVAAGPIAAALAGAGVGAAAGGMFGALTDMGVPGEEASYYEEAIRRGGTVLIVRGDNEMAEKAESIVDRHGAIDLAESVKAGDLPPAVLTSPIKKGYSRVYSSAGPGKQV